MNESVPVEVAVPPLYPVVAEGEKVVLVLGAGATISEAIGNSVNSQDLPPTDASFLQCARKAFSGNAKVVADLYREATDGREPYPFEKQRMEQLFASAYLMVQRTKGTTKLGRVCRQLYDELTVLLRDTLWRTTKDLEPVQHTQLIKMILERKPSKFDVISFNYDPIADRALRDLDRDAAVDWHHSTGYGFAPHDCSKRAATENLQIKLYKMHGSMNWYIDVPGKERDSVFNANADIHVPQVTGFGAKAWSNRQKSIGHSETRRAFPLLVPPVFEKSTQISGKLNGVWEGATNALAEASLVIVWGYSLPPSDYHAEYLFAGCARHSGSRLIVMNPSSQAWSRVTEVAGHKWCRWFFSVEDALTSAD